MKKIQRIPALLLAMLMLFSLTLTSCGSKEDIASPDQVAVALFNMILKNDASTAVELFGYADEAAARKDMGLEDSIYDELAEQLGAEMDGGSTEDARAVVDAFMNMFKDVNLTAKVKESDEKAGTAVVTCTINTFESGAMDNILQQIMTDIMSDETLLSADEATLYSTIINKMAEGLSALTPTENTADFDVNFELVKADINGKEKSVWLPVDVEEFGALISNTALGY